MGTCLIAIQDDREGNGPRLALSFTRRLPDSSGFHHYNALKVCPMCHRIWAYVFVDRTTECASPEAVSCRQCEWHSPHRPGIPGSLLEQGIHQRIDWDLLDQMPEELLRREVEVTFAAWDKKPW